MDIGNRIRLLREEKGVGQKELASLLDVQVSAISRYESGARVPPPDKLVVLADRFSVSADYLMGRTDDRKEFLKHETLESKSTDIEDASFYEIIDLLAAATDEERKTALGIVKALLKK